MKQAYKNASLNSLSMLALGSGIMLIQSDLVTGLVLVVVGMALQGLREFLKLSCKKGKK